MSSDMDPHRAITKKTSSNNKSRAPQQGSSLFSQSGYIKLPIIPKQHHKSPAEHLQDQTRCPDYNETGIYLSQSRQHKSYSYIINMFIHRIHYHIKIHT